MRKKFLYVALAGCLACLCSCSDTILGAFGGSSVELEVVLNIPGSSVAATRAVVTRVGGDNETYSGLDYTTAYQYYIGTGDVYVLLFEQDADDPDNDVLYAVPAVTIDGSNGDSERTVRGSLSKDDIDKSLKVDVCVNLAQNGCFGLSSATQVRARLQQYLGASRQAVYNAIGTFSCPGATEDNPYGIWSLDADNGGRYLPMWGATSTPLYLDTGSEDTYTASCSLYRSVAKMGVTVDNSCSTFDLREVYLYYINEEGKFISSETPSITETIQYTEPDVPDNVTHRDIEHPLVFKGITTSSFTDQIYLAEADNQDPVDGEPVVMVVGGIYKGGDYGGEGLGTTQQTLNYYRIDMIDNSNGYTDANGVFNIIRNHSYTFNILSANNPGTSDPDPRRAADGLEVEVLDYTDVPLNGINSQYTLTVSQSLFSFDGMTADIGTLIVNSDELSGWELLTEDLGEYGVYVGDDLVTSTADWVHLTEGEHTGTDDEITIDVDANIADSLTRSTVFVIKSGEVIKVIHVVQNYGEAGNSYLLTNDGSYALKVDYRGNGRTIAWTNDEGTTSESIDFNLGRDITNIAKVGIIWETADGFVTLDGDTDNDGFVTILGDDDEDANDAVRLTSSGCIAYTVHNQSLNTYHNWTGNVFDAGNGANALIGAYDSDNDLLWSWHIWAVGDYAIADSVLTEPWQSAVVTSSNSGGNTGGGPGGNSTTYTATYKDFYFMDRNLGAYSNLPGSASFGLLYQWGRKDPFIGAYREESEQDYHTVPKQYTKMYTNPKTNSLWAWGDYDDSSVTQESAEVDYTIKNPTTILRDGLLSEEHTDDTAHGLWGTTSYAFDAGDDGNKTMYDPCPVGYRVPSLNALTFYDGANSMWDGQHSDNLVRYVPIKSGNTYMTGSGSGSDFVSDAPFYGFWFDYHGDYGFANSYSSNTAESYGAYYYYENATAEQKNQCGWMLNYVGSKPDNVTWIPLAGIYNGSMDHFARAGLTENFQGNGALLPASSLQVTSVMWANSPTSTNVNYPAGLLIHGTEGAYTPHSGTSYFQYAAGEYNGESTQSTVATSGEGFWTTATTGYGGTAVAWWTGSVDDDPSTGTWNYATGYTNLTWSDENGFTESGRHFHSYADTDVSVLANPSYAASVRCIRDKDTKTHREEKLMDEYGDDYNGGELDLYLYETYIDEENCTRDEISLTVSYDEAWEVTTPGAKWVSISPSSGKTAKGDGDTETITISVNTSVVTDEYPAINDTATIKIYFLATGTTKTITVKYAGTTRDSSTD